MCWQVTKSLARRIKERNGSLLFMFFRIVNLSSLWTGIGMEKGGMIWKTEHQNRRWPRQMHRKCLQQKNQAGRRLRQFRPCLRQVSQQTHRGCLRQKDQMKRKFQALRRRMGPRASRPSRRVQVRYLSNRRHK